MDTDFEHAFYKTVFKRDLPLYQQLIDFSGVTHSVQRDANIRLYVVPHIYEWFRISVLYYIDEDGERDRIVLAFTNAEKELEAVHELKSLVTVDSLTQLPNINTFSMQTWELLKNHPEREYAIVRMDIRKFRLLNEFYGTSEGDNVLRFLGVKLQECMDSEELYTYCHLTSDIFAVCMPSDMESIYRVIDSIQTSMNHYPVNFEMVMSFGIYIIMEMNNALGSDQFHIYLQPKVDMITGRIVGSEALVRWIHPTKGVISPVDFVPIFEGNGFISEIDFYMLEQVCKMIRRWLDKGLEAKPVSVNLSRSNLYRPRILNDIMTCVERYSVPHDLIEFEITESAFAVDNIHLNQLMEQLQKNHFRVLMDDFGSGYSSLNALRELSVDILKIDIKFLPVSQNDKRADIILRSVTQMADQLGLEIVVEGVETEAQADLLKKMGCRIAQGFLYYRPMPIEEYERVLKKQK